MPGVLRGQRFGGVALRPDAARLGLIAIGAIVQIAVEQDMDVAIFGELRCLLEDTVVGAPDRPIMARIDEDLRLDPRHGAEPD